MGWIRIKLLYFMNQIRIGRLLYESDPVLKNYTDPVDPDLTACLKYQLKCVSGGEIVFEGLCSLLLMQKNLQYDYKSWQITLRVNKFKNVYASHI